jgi:FkbM family methyltransferase
LPDEHQRATTEEMEAMFLSYAQNGEDILLWRALGSVEVGTYVDVGAADPVADSVTKVFYERGWSGVNVEPVPAFAAALEADRPRDRTYQCCAGAEAGTTTLHVVRDTGLSTQLDDQLDSIREQEYEVDDLEVEVRRLDELIADAGIDGPIHFLKVDVEGMERAVLEGIDLSVLRPWVIVVEATLPMSSTPTYEGWEGLLTGRGYTFCLFDGLNRFYAAGEHPELLPLLSYPACVFDEPRLRDQIQDLQRRVIAQDRQLRSLTTSHDDLAARLADEVAARAAAEELAERSLSDGFEWRTQLIHARSQIAMERANAHQIALRHLQATQRLEELDAFISAMSATVSWRVTRPLRGVRRVLNQVTPKAVPTAPEPEPTLADEPVSDLVPDAAPGGPHVDAFVRRIDAVCSLLVPGATAPSPAIGDALARLEQSLTTSLVDSMIKGWLAIVGATGSYPTEAEMEVAGRLFRRHGARALIDHMQVAFGEALLERGELPDLDVVIDTVLIDVSHTAMYDLHTGIQRVVRECASRWLQTPKTDLVQWSHRDRSAKRLHDDERERFVYWRDHMHAAGGQMQARQPVDRNGATVVPWGCTVLVPEVIDATVRSGGYVALARSGVLRRFAMIGYDLIPMTAAETVTEGMTATFGGYLSLLKHADRVSAISESAANEFRGFNVALSAQGLAGPIVTATPLPAAPTETSEAQIAEVRELFGLGSALPLVLAVGSHEPRKNHIRLLEAAEALWDDGHHFELLLVGGASWGRPEFKSYVEYLSSAGRPVRVFQRISEVSLWSLYRLARFSIFTSLIEGYGLPVAESLSCGTPAITTSYGSMAEVAAGGGAIVVDPRDVPALQAAMALLLTDDARLEDLRQEALARTWPTWDDYAAAVWADAVEP